MMDNKTFRLKTANLDHPLNQFDQRAGVMFPILHTDDGSMSGIFAYNLVEFHGKCR